MLIFLRALLVTNYKHNLTRQFSSRSASAKPQR